MPDTPTISTPPLAGPAGAALCRGCSAPLAADQRYCLSCGARVGEPHAAAFELLGLAGAAGPTSGPAAAAAGPDSLVRRLDRLGGPMGLAAVVLVALGVGFLLGQGGGGSGAQTIIQRPPVVNVTSAGAAPSDTSGEAGSESADGTAKSGKHGKGSSADTTGVPKATQDDAGGDLTKLQAQPKEQATGGEAPPTDDKAAGGGSAVETIG